MTSYTTTQEPNSISGLVLIPTALGAVALVALAPSSAISSSIEEKVYDVDSTSSSYFNVDSYSTTSIGDVEDFSETLSSFYGELANKQESLGDEFSKVLNENIWELYES